MIRSLLSVCTAALLLVACGGPLKYEIASTPKAPGADGLLVATVHESQHQTEVELEVKNLPPPDRVTEGATDYVAWSRKNTSAAWTRLGSLAYDPKDRGGTMKGSVPETSFDFAISAEKAALAASPSSEIVFKQRVGE
ncbi:MAG TPA: hypothetical protein VER96_09445 [Polyangiaceae bacterium]|nr:hypothetical protein [Polyangiaceae bacterium]